MTAQTGGSAPQFNDSVAPATTTREVPRVDTISAVGPNYLQEASRLSNPNNDNGQSRLDANGNLDTGMGNMFNSVHDGLRTGGTRTGGTGDTTPQAPSADGTGDTNGDTRGGSTGGDRRSADRTPAAPEQLNTRSPEPVTRTESPPSPRPENQLARAGGG